MMYCWLLGGDAVIVLSFLGVQNCNLDLYVHIGTHKVSGIYMYTFALGAARHTVRDVRPYSLPYSWCNLSLG